MIGFNQNLCMGGGNSRFKLVIFFVLLALCAMFAFATVAQAAQAEEGDDPSATDQQTSTDGSRVAMFRLYNKWTGEHFYTSSKSERDNIAKVGWVYEQIEWYAPTSEDFKPVYLLYNKYVSGGDHHYTTSSDEKTSASKLVGLTKEKTGEQARKAQLTTSKF